MRGLFFGAAILSMASPVFSETIDYGYDTLGRLIASGRFQGPLDGYRTGLYFDAAGNRFLYNVQDVRFILSAGQSIASSDGRTKLMMQSDGNLVLYFQSTALWSSQTSGSGADRAIMQSDGNLVVYTPSSSAVWSSNTSGNYGSQLIVGNDGNVIIYSVSLPVWATNTGGH